MLFMQHAVCPPPEHPPSFAASSFLISFNVIIAGVALNAIFIACTPASSILIISNAARHHDFGSFIFREKPSFEQFMGIVLASSYWL